MKRSVPDDDWNDCNVKSFSNILICTADVDCNFMNLLERTNLCRFESTFSIENASLLSSTRRLVYSFSSSCCESILRAECWQRKRFSFASNERKIIGKALIVPSSYLLLRSPAFLRYFTRKKPDNFQLSHGRMQMRLPTNSEKTRSTCIFGKDRKQSTQMIAKLIQVSELIAFGEAWKITKMGICSPQ